MDCCCHKTKHRSDEEQKKLTHRLNRIEGQVRGLREMLQKDAYCPDILIEVLSPSAPPSTASARSCWPPTSVPAWPMASVRGMTPSLTSWSPPCKSS